MPLDTSWQVFLAKAWIPGEEPERVERHIDMPWTKLGDFYYMDKLAASISASRAIQWRRVPP